MTDFAGYESSVVGAKNITFKNLEVREYVNDKMRNKILFVIFSLCCISSFSQNDSVLKDRFYRHTYENDFFVATDRYYTQGVYLEFIFPAFKKLLLSHALIPLKSGKVTNYYAISTERQGFTPTSIRHFGLP